MNARKVLIMITVFFSTFVLIGASNLTASSMQTAITSTPTLLLITPTTTAIPTLTETLAPDNKEVPTNKDLLDHFEKVTTSILTVTTIVITFLGVLGSLGIYFGKSTFSELSSQVEKLKNSISEMEVTQERLKGELERAEYFSQSLINRYRYLVECRNSQPSVRIRAIQQLSASNDIAVISLMSEILVDDDNADVRAEAAFALSTLLIHSNGENSGVDALISALNDNSPDVKLQAIQALDNLICNQIVLPRKVYVRLEALSSSKQPKNITEACTLALKHKQRVIEENITNNTENNQSGS